MPEASEKQRSLWSRIRWLVLIWVLSVLSLFVVAAVLKALMYMVGMTT